LEDAAHDRAGVLRGHAACRHHGTDEERRDGRCDLESHAHGPDLSPRSSPRGPHDSFSSPEYEHSALVTIRYGDVRSPITVEIPHDDLDRTGGSVELDLAWGIGANLSFGRIHEDEKRSFDLIRVPEHEIGTPITVEVSGRDARRVGAGEPGRDRARRERAS